MKIIFFTFVGIVLSTTPNVAVAQVGVKPPAELPTRTTQMIFPAPPALTACLKNQTLRLNWRHLGLERIIGYDVYECSNTEALKRIAFVRRPPSELMDISLSFKKVCIQAVQEVPNDNLTQISDLSSPVEIQMCN